MTGNHNTSKPLMSRRAERILFTSFAPLPFVTRDQQFLSGRFKVRSVMRGWVTAAPSLIVNAFWADLFFCWFASVSAALLVFLARILGKPTVIVVGGIDVA